ncbi:V-set and immunoglobulin domain-containing protein 10-like 2 [Nerophis lumbriciformis]|uniref:V-set and immunoglobulin domain-containing protein 10-like 2 n=1 Tax=Nerophis lumbriciformis TaxID=546530 RepID=UPI003BAC6A68
MSTPEPTKYFSGDSETSSCLTARVPGRKADVSSMFLHAVLIVVCLLLPPLPALPDAEAEEEVEYRGANATASTGGSVRLDCGATPPSVFIWGFTRSGSDNNVALVYADEHGAKVQARPGGPGRVLVPADTCALVIEGVREEAAGTYTCQALYHVGGGARVVFYSTRLDVRQSGRR